MAFGKDDAALDRVGSYRQRAHYQTKSTFQNRPRGGGGGGLTFIDQFKPSTDIPDLIRIVPGDYEVQQATPEGEIETTRQPYVAFGEHFHGTLKRSCVCSAGPLYGWKDKRSPCYACDIFWQGMTVGQDGKKKKGPMSRRDMSSFTVIHYHPYHEVEQVDSTTGQYRVNARTGQPYTNWVKCEGRGCKMCQAGKKTNPAHRLHWDMGTGHMGTLWEYDKEIGRSCATCSGRDTIEWDAMVCRQCGEAKVVRDETNLKPKEIEEIYGSLNTCSACGFKGFLREIISCRNCTPLGREPERATIFAVDMKVKRAEPESGGNQTTLMIPQWNDPSPVAQQFAEFNKPMPLEKIFAPTSLENQAKVFDLSPAAIQGLIKGKQPPQRQPVTAEETSRPYRA
jgi:hypothetical protein